MRDLQADLELISKATPGPWEYTPGEWDCERECGSREDCYIGESECKFIQQTIPASVSNVFTVDCGDYYGLNDNDAQFIAAAREGWPEAIKRAIKAEEEVVRLRAGLERIKTTIEEYHPHDTLTLPKFSFAKELHDIASAELEVHDEG